MKYLVTALVLLTVGCVNVGTKPESAEEEQTLSPPQLWSDHKLLEISVEECGEKGARALQSLSYSAISKNGNFSYGNFSSNRAAVKCIEDGSGSLVYIMVAGPNRKEVERLRNELAWKFN